MRPSRFTLALCILGPATLGLALASCGTRSPIDPNQSARIGKADEPQATLETFELPTPELPTIRGLDDAPRPADQRSVFGLSRRNWPESTFLVPQGDTRHDPTYASLRTLTRASPLRDGRFPTIDDADVMPNPSAQRDQQIEAVVQPFIALYEGVMILPRAALDAPGTWQSTSPVAGRTPDARVTLDTIRSGPREVPATPVWELPLMAPAASPGAKPATPAKPKGVRGPMLPFPPATVEPQR